MKKIRFFLVISVVLLAVGGAFASRYFESTYFKLVLLEGDIFCVPVAVSFSSCSTSITGIPCELTSSPLDQLRAENTPWTSCGLLLWREY